MDTDNSSGGILSSLEAVSYECYVGVDVMPKQLHVDVMVAVTCECVQIVGFEHKAELILVGGSKTIKPLCFLNFR